MDTRTEWQKRIGVGERAPGHITEAGKQPRVRPIHRDNEKRGQVVGAERDHADGRKDAKAYLPTNTVEVSPERFNQLRSKADGAVATASSA